MKKILLSAAALCVFGFAITLTQISCQKSIAQTNPTTTSNLFLFSKTKGGFINELWAGHLDGSASTKVNISLPVPYVLDASNARFTSDAKTIIFIVKDTTGSKLVNGDLLNTYFYSCSLDGGNARPFLPKENGAFFDLLDVK